MKTQPIIDIDTEYLSKVYYNDRFIRTIKKSLARVKEFQKSVKFDAIAFTGTSGAALAYILSYTLKKPLICVRKRDNSHSSMNIEGCVSAKSYIIVDDFIDSGRTVKNIMNKIGKRMPEAKPVAIFLYDDWGYKRTFLDIPIKRVK